MTEPTFDERRITHTITCRCGDPRLLAQECPTCGYCQKYFEPLRLNRIQLVALAKALTKADLLKETLEGVLASILEEGSMDELAYRWAILVVPLARTSNLDIDRELLDQVAAHLIWIHERHLVQPGEPRKEEP